MVDGSESRQYLLSSTESVPLPLKTATYSSGQSYDERPDDPDFETSIVSVTIFLASGTLIIHVQSADKPATVAGMDMAPVVVVSWPPQLGAVGG